MNKTQILLGSLIAVSFLAMAGFYFFVPRHCSQGDQEDIYYIDEEFDRVRKILVRTDSLEEIVSYQHGEVLYQEWKNLDLSMRRLLGPWDVNGSGELVVRTEDPDAGSLVLKFRQTVHIDEDSLVSKTFLDSPVGNLKEYITELVMVREGEKTHVKNRIIIKYERRLPTSYIDYMDQKISESVSQGLEKNREAITSLIARYSGSRIILPIKRK
jgi:hypothetical protein